MCVINKDGKLKARWKHEKWCDQHATSTGQRNLWYSPACHECLGGSVVRASDRCTGGQRFNFCRGLRFFSLSSARDMLITSFLISSPSLKSIVCLIFFYLTLSLPECLMEFWNVTLTFEYVDKILWCDHSNENSLPVLSHDAICFSKFHKIKFGNLAEVCFWLNLAVKGLRSWCFCWLAILFALCDIVQCVFGLLYYVRANNDEGLTLETSPFQTLFSVVVIRVNKEIHKKSSMSWFLYHRVRSIDFILE